VSRAGLPATDPLRNSPCRASIGSKNGAVDQLPYERSSDPPEGGKSWALQLQPAMEDIRERDEEPDIGRHQRRPRDQHRHHRRAQLAQLGHHLISTVASAGSARRSSCATLSPGSVGVLQQRPAGDLSVCEGWLVGQVPQEILPHLLGFSSDAVSHLGYDLISNWAYMVIAALAWNIKAWYAMMMHRKSDRLEYINMEFRRFIHCLVLIPCHVIRRARSITLRLVGYQRSLDRFLSTWNTIERIVF
jgi:hypothetical protein